MTRFLLALTVLLCSAGILPAAEAADRPPPLPPSIAALLGPQDSLLVIDSRGRVRMHWQADVPRIPASVLKLLTAQVAWHHFGPGYRFSTIYRQDAAGNLYVRGQGDPLFISEVIAQDAARLAPLLAPVADIVLDDTYFDRPLTIPGVSDSLNPYDAPVGALGANFNTVFVRPGPGGGYQSAEPQTPMVPFVARQLADRPPAAGRLVLTHDGQTATRYVGHLLGHFLAVAGRPPAGTVRLGQATSDSRPVLRSASPFDISEVLRRMLEYSSNFVANQLLVAAGARVYGPPGTLEKGVRLAEVYARETLGLVSLQLAEGSGISRSNRISAADLAAVLTAFSDHRGLLRHDGRVWCKTGTLSGIQSRAGYIDSTENGPYRFVILINTAGHRADPVLRALLPLLP